jgi:elongation factor P
MYETSDIRKGLKIQMDGYPFVVVEFQFVKPGKGTAFTRTKLKNMITGAVLDRTFRTGEKLEPANIEDKQMQYLYQEGDNYCFMDTTSYEQVFIPAEVLGDTAQFMPDNTNVDALFFDDKPIGVTLPNFVELEVTHTEPGVKGDTASGATKPATLSTGGVVNVPLFIEQGEWLRIDTRTCEYVERVKK